MDCADDSRLGVCLKVVVVSPEVGFGQVSRKGFVWGPI